MKEEYKLSHLKELEAESIHIIREVAAEFENPVMLYSIGKDSSRKNRVRRNVFSLSAINSTNGILRTSALNCGIYIMHVSIKGRASACSR